MCPILYRVLFSSTFFHFYYWNIFSDFTVKLSCWKSFYLQCWNIYFKKYNFLTLSHRSWCEIISFICSWSSVFIIFTKIIKNMASLLGKSLLKLFWKLPEIFYWIQISITTNVSSGWKVVVHTNTIKFFIVILE